MQRLKIGRAVITFVLLTMAYVAVLLWLDRGRGLLNGLDRLYLTLPTLMLLSLVSYVLRYARWFWLLARVQSRVPPLRGFFAYIAGFALTATPGKVGELLRIRYFQPIGIHPELVVSAFVYERSLDVIVVLGIAALAAVKFGLLKVVVAFSVFVVAVALILVNFTGQLTYIVNFMDRRNLPFFARVVGIFARGFSKITIWLTPLDLLVSLITGLAAWVTTAYSFVLLLDHLGATVPTLLALSIYPAAILVGAASMLPGGIGSTEAALVVLLVGVGVSLADATMAAIGIRIASMWFATLLGLVSVCMLELGPKSTS
jgi:uncharacterized protein (TIRG00374 family)